VGYQILKFLDVLIGEIKMVSTMMDPLKDKENVDHAMLLLFSQQLKQESE